MDFLTKFANFSGEILYPCAFAAVCTCAFLIYFAFKGKKEQKPDFKFFYWYLAGGAAIIAGGLLLKLKLGISAVRYAEIVFEGFSWAVAVSNYIVLRKKGIFDTKVCRLTQWEWMLAGVNFVLGILLVVIMGMSKADYYIGLNTFFNADLGRGVYSAITDVLPHSTHPLYRFAGFPFFALARVIARIISADYLLPGAYLVLLIQVLLNGISAVVLKRTLVKLEFSSTIAWLGGVLYISSFPVMWLDIFPETYCLAALALILGVYAHLCGSNLKYPLFILAMGVNPATAALSALIILSDVLKNREKIFAWIKSHKIISGAAGAAGVLILAVFTVFSIKYIGQWTAQKPLSGKLLQYVVSPWIFGPDYLNLSPFFVQTGELSFFKTATVCFVIAVCIYGAIKYRKKDVVLCCLGYIAVAVLFHGLLGFGKFNSVIYCGLYGWCFVLLFVCGMDMVARKLHTMSGVFIAALAVLCLIMNLLWFSSIKNDVAASVSSKAVRMSTDTPYYLDGCEGSFSVRDGMVIYENTQILVDDFDGFIYCDNEKIWGLKSDGSAFIVFCKDGSPRAESVDEYIYMIP
ncbi:MAG: hypothetical protein IJL87_04775 [Clostridia bacterium]|nr:hypothetical protein [Clostridia bacterium]